MSSINFFASSEDLTNIFGKVEEEFDLKYCKEYADPEPGKSEKPQIEFHTIDEIVNNERDHYLICAKGEIIQTNRIVTIDNETRYITRYSNNKNCVVLSKKADPPDAIGDYQLYIADNFDSEYAKKLFKRFVKEIKSNCVRVKCISPFYVGRELYKNKEDYVFGGMNFAFLQIVTETGEAKRWWRNPNVREFMEKPMEDHLQFLRDVFSNKVLQNFDEEQKRRTEDYEIYQGVMYKLLMIKDLGIISVLFSLFDDGAKVRTPFYARKSAMEELRDMAIELAFSKKADGFKVLLENLKNVPDAGYNCGKLELITTLLKKRYFETFKESLPLVTDETKEIIKDILDDISIKRLQDQVNETMNLLSQ